MTSYISNTKILLVRSKQKQVIVRKNRKKSNANLLNGKKYHRETFLHTLFIDVKFLWKRIKLVTKSFSLAPIRPRFKRVNSIKAAPFG